MRLHLFACCFPLIAFATASVAQEQDTFDCVIKPREIVEMGSLGEGILIERLVNRGDIVEAGQVVARLDDARQKLELGVAKRNADRDEEIQSRVAAAEFRADELVRITDLVERELTASVEIERAALERQLAEFALDAARLDQELARDDLKLAQDALDRRTIRTQVSGIVVDTRAAPGDYVNAQTTILTLAKLDVLNVEVFLPTEVFGLAVEGAHATVLPQEPIGGSYKATIETVDRVFDAASGTFGVRLTLPNADYGLPAGLRCRVIFTKSQP